MTLKNTVTLSVVIWATAISGLHAWLNLDLFRKETAAKGTFKVGFLPVT